MRPLFQLLYHPLLVTVYQWLKFGCPGLPEEILSCDDLTPSFGGFFDKASEDIRLLPNSADGFHDVGRQLKAKEKEPGLTAMGILAGLVGLIVPPCIWLLAAWLYKEKVSDRRDPFLPSDSIPPDWSMVQRDFTKGVCQCFDDCQICLHGWCCWPIRVADTYKATNIQPYWMFIALEEGVYIASNFLGFIIYLASSGEADLAGVFYALGQIFVACWLAQQRGRLREKFGGTSEEYKILDCCCYYCCGMCIACQEAAQVDGAMGVEVNCCCKYAASAKIPAATMIGQPVATATPLKGEAMAGAAPAGASAPSAAVPAAGPPPEAPPAAAAPTPVVQPAENNAAETNEAANE